MTTSARRRGKTSAPLTDVEQQLSLLLQRPPFDASPRRLAWECALLIVLPETWYAAQSQPDYPGDDAPERWRAASMARLQRLLQDQAGDVAAEWLAAYEREAAPYSRCLQALSSRARQARIRSAIGIRRSPDTWRYRRWAAAWINDHMPELQPAAPAAAEHEDRRLSRFVVRR